MPRLVLLEDVPTLDEARRLLELMRDGASLVCCRTMPDEWTCAAGGAGTRLTIGPLRAGFPRGARAREDRGCPSAGWKAALADAQSVRWTPASAQLSFQHRRVQGGEIYFLTNWGEPFRAKSRFPTRDLTPEIWDADTGTTLPAAQLSRRQGRTAVSLSLGPHESHFVVFTQAQPALHAGALRRWDGSCASGRQALRPARQSGPCRVELSDGSTRELRGATARAAVAWTDPGSSRPIPPTVVGLTAPVTCRAGETRLLARDSRTATFAGIASYADRVRSAARLTAEILGCVLELGTVYELADVWLNGHHVGRRAGSRRMVST